jgi:hypothetical protein
MTKMFCLSNIVSTLTAAAVLCVFLFAPESSYCSDYEKNKALKTDGKHLKKSIVHLYFADRQNEFLMAEERPVFSSDGPEQLGVTIITELIKGPEKELMRTIPAGVSLRAFYIAENKTAFVDLSKDITTKHPGGIKSEILTIYSIVNTLILNITEINAVKIIIDGHESLTLTGHIDLRSPFKANMLLIR